MRGLHYPTPILCWKERSDQISSDIADKLGQYHARPYTFSWTEVAAWTYTLNTKSWDNAGAATTSTVNCIASSNMAIAVHAADITLRLPESKSSFTKGITIPRTLSDLPNTKL